MTGLLLVVLSLSAPGGAQADPCPPCRRADSLAARGDTMAAIALLRGKTEGSESALLWGKLGTLLTRAAPTEETDFEMRLEAEEALERAYELDPYDPRWYFALGLLRRKQGFRAGAGYIFERAIDRSEDSGGELGRRERAELHAEWGRVLEEWVLNFRGLLPDADHVPVNSAECSGTGGAFCLNFNRPEAFHGKLFTTAPQDSLVVDDARKMRAQFRTAFELDPALDVAARGLLGYLAWEGSWNRFVSVARAHVRAQPANGWAWVFLGAGHFRAGSADSARAAFDHALLRLDEGERETLERVREIIAAEDAGTLEQRRSEYRDLLWKVSDPFYLTGVNERRLEHYTRTALAELWFGEPRRGRRGYETDRGVILIRYGEPTWIRQIKRDEMSARAAAGTSNPGRASAAATVSPAAGFGGRWIFWTYRRDIPSFIFERQLSSRTVRHAFQTRSAEYAEDFRSRFPSLYTIRGATGLPHQAVRFRGPGRGVTLDVYAALPRDTAAEPREGDAGLYFLPRTAVDEPEEMRSTVRFGPGRRTVVFRAPLERSRYTYSVEALSNDGGIKARARATADFTDFATEGFGLSDVLVARRIVPRTAAVRDRRDLEISVPPGTGFPAGAPLALYFEVYGLSFEAPDPGSASTARFRVAVEATGADDRGVPGFIRRIGEFLTGGEESGVITWERTVEGPRDRMPEWFTLTLPAIGDGAYTLRVTVEDLRTGERTSTTRNFEIEGP